MNRLVFANSALWLLCLAFLGAHELYSADQRPLIAVKFEIKEDEAPEFYDNLAKVLPKVEEDLTRDLVKYFNGKLSFYDWTSGLDPKDPSRLAALLTVSLKRGDRGSPNYNILLVFTGEIRKSGAVFKCDAKDPMAPSTSSFSLPLYAGSENQPTRRKKQIEEDVMRKI